MSALRPELQESLEEFERARARRDALRRLLAEQRGSLAGRVQRVLSALARLFTGRA